MENKYEEDFKSAKEWYRIAKEQDNKLAIEILESKFPELKESEDEKVRNFLIGYFDKLIDENSEWGLTKETREKIITWLEKQGEHAKFRDSIQVGDKVTRNQDGVLVNLSQLKRIAKPAEEYNITGIGSKRAEGKLAEMIKELKPLDAILEEQGEQKPVEPQQDMLSQEKYAKAVDECIYGEKSEWSEEDENRVNRLIAYFEDKESFTAEDDIVYANWLKSFRPQNTWKPSDEQMEVLNEVINYAANSELQHWSSFIYTLLKSLREQLKKLKE